MGPVKLTDKEVLDIVDLSLIKPRKEDSNSMFIAGAEYQQQFDRMVGDIEHSK